MASGVFGAGGVTGDKLGELVRDNAFVETRGR